MARVTVEDCILLVPNRFDLVMMAGARAREIASGAVLHVDRDRDKNPVVALREIAEEKLNLETMSDNLIKGYQRRVDNDSSEEELKELMAEEQKWATAAAAMAEGMVGADADEDEDEDEEGAADEELNEVQFEDAPADELKE
ncbi:MAG: DNA-directed RNA polymerase subunit omega [Alphaproteobacteria bacterium]|nr:DNA-directed RNA polymerase subunit omega [Alphaproteobacteria bacterium]